ncbi:FMN-binding protein [Kitasatospora sp. NPDC002227]|uniref:FMN-binding protein n=1 Tax=Kitasatospora sp. NPDC002227 TaxID=3154773 RepID=UPI00331A6936
MRRAVVTGTATVAGIVLLLSLKPHDGPGNSTVAKVISSGTSPSAAASAPSSPSTATGSGSSPAAAPSPSASAASRVVTGNAIDTRYGPVQVRVTLDSGKITKVDVLQYPAESHRDREINTYALPELNQEALAAQNARIDAVSGATYTSDGYTRSLQSALDQAGLT